MEASYDVQEKRQDTIHRILLSLAYSLPLFNLLAAPFLTIVAMIRIYLKSANRVKTYFRLFIFCLVWVAVPAILYVFHGDQEFVEGGGLLQMVIGQFIVTFIANPNKFYLNES